MDAYAAKKLVSYRACKALYEAPSLSNGSNDGYVEVLLRLLNVAHTILRVYGKEGIRDQLTSHVETVHAIFMGACFYPGKLAALPRVEQAAVSSFKNTVRYAWDGLVKAIDA